MAHVVEINDLKELQSYRLLWKSLFADTPQASFFRTFEWFETFWKHYGAERHMKVLVVYAAGTPIGIVPLCVQRERYQIGNVRVLTYPLSDWGMWYGPIGAQQTATMHLALKHIRESKRDWDLIDLRWIPPCRRVRRGMARVFRWLGWNPQQRFYQQTSNIDLTGYTWESYFASRSKKWRHETRRHMRAIEKHGEVSFQRCRPLSSAEGDGEPHWEFFEQCLAISRKSWQAKSADGNTLCHKHVQPFLTDCHAVAARLGMVDMTLLSMDGTPVAYQYNYHYDGQLFGLRMGFDHNYSKLRAGSVLLSLSLEDSFQRGDRLIEMGIGDSQYKQRVRTSRKSSYRLTYYPTFAWRAQGVRLTQAIKRPTDRLETASA